MKRQVKMISRGQKIRLFIALGILMMSGMLGSVSVKAVELPYYAQIYVGNDRLADMARESEDGCAQISDGRGGTATYCMETNTLTLNNFWLETEEGICCSIDIYYMGDFTIELIGKNYIHTHPAGVDNWPPQSICTTNTNLTIKGPGSLEANETINMGMVCKIIDCKIILYGKKNGIYGDKDSEAYIDNSEIEIVLKNELPQLYQGAMGFGKLKVRNSLISLTSAPGHESQGDVLAYIPRALDLQYEYGPIDLGEDMVMTDKDGNALIGRKLREISGKRYVYVYSTEGKWKNHVQAGVEQDFGIIKDNVYNATTTVVIKSANKASSVNMEKKIEELASMDINTDAYGIQLSECEEDYTKLSEEAKKLVSNQFELTKAREAYEENNQKKAQEVEDKISSIGKVDDNSQEKIKEAQDAYDKLTQDQKDKVTNVGVLESAAKEYEQIVQEKKAQADAEAAKETEKETEKETKKETEKETISNKIGRTKITYIKSKKKRQITLKWKKDKTCDGYQISYSTDKKFKKNKKTKTIKNKKTYRYTLTKLKSKKVYYIRIRKYRIIDNKKTYGPWSTVKKIRVK